MHGSLLILLMQAQPPSSNVHGRGQAGSWQRTTGQPTLNINQCIVKTLPLGRAHHQGGGHGRLAGSGAPTSRAARTAAQSRGRGAGHVEGGSVLQLLRVAPMPLNCRLAATAPSSTAAQRAKHRGYNRAAAHTPPAGGPGGYVAPATLLTPSISLHTSTTSLHTFHYFPSHLHSPPAWGPGGCAASPFPPAAGTCRRCTPAVRAVCVGSTSAV